MNRADTLTFFTEPRPIHQPVPADQLDALTAAATFEYDPNEPRDEKGKWDSAGGGPSPAQQLLDQWRQDSKAISSTMFQTGEQLLGFDTNRFALAEADQAKAAIAQRIAAGMHSSTPDMLEAVHALGNTGTRTADDLHVSDLGNHEVYGSWDPILGTLSTIQLGTPGSPEYRSDLAAKADDPKDPNRFRMDDPRADGFTRQFLASSMASMWAKTSNDSSRGALAIQEAAKEEFGLHGTAPWFSPPPPGARDAMDHLPVYRDFLRAQYDDTQQFLHGNGIKELTVARGWSWDYAVPAWAQTPGGATVETVGLRPLSSWTTRSITAADFASYGAHGAVAYARVPAEKILSCARTGLGCLQEREFVLLGGQEQVLVAKKALPNKVTAAATFVYDPNQPRDDHGRWDSTGGSGDGKAAWARTEKLSKLIVAGTAAGRPLDLTDTDRSAFKAQIADARAADLQRLLGERPALRAEFDRQMAYEYHDGKTHGEGLQWKWAHQEVLKAQSAGDRSAATAMEASSISNWQPILDWANSHGGIPPVEELWAADTATRYVNHWADTAADTSGMALALQHATAEELGAHSASFDAYMGRIPTFAREQYDQVHGIEAETMKAFARAEYDATQRYLADAGFKPGDQVALFRGMKFGGKGDVGAPPAGFPTAPGTATVPIDLNPASSWTVDEVTARMPYFSGVGGYLLTDHVPVRDIISTPRTGRGSALEGEIVVRNRPGQTAQVERL